MSTDSTLRRSDVMSHVVEDCGCERTVWLHGDGASISDKECQMHRSVRINKRALEAEHELDFAALGRALRHAR